MPSFSTTGMRLIANACSSFEKYHRFGEMGSPGQKAKPMNAVGRVMMPSAAVVSHVF